jgi:hypothetical protein
VLDLLRGNEPDTVHVTLPTSLVIRGTTAAPRP